MSNKKKSLGEKNLSLSDDKTVVKNTENEENGENEENEKDEENEENSEIVFLACKQFIDCLQEYYSCKYPKLLKAKRLLSLVKKQNYKTINEKFLNFIKDNLESIKKGEELKKEKIDLTNKISINIKVLLGHRNSENKNIILSHLLNIWIKHNTDDLETKKFLKDLTKVKKKKSENIIEEVFKDAENQMGGNMDMSKLLSSGFINKVSDKFGNGGEIDMKAVTGTLISLLQMVGDDKNDELDMADIYKVVSGANNTKSADISLD